MSDVVTAQKIACEDMLRDVAALARQVEEAGGPPQGQRLADFARYVADGNLGSAMVVRDRIASELREATKPVDVMSISLLAIALTPVALLFVAALWRAAKALF